jgi:cyclase
MLLEKRRRRFLQIALVVIGGVFLTFTDSVTFYWNNETLEVLHPKPAHTDGDAVIYFKNTNVVHIGDLFFNGIYPFIDAESGGSLEGVIAGVDEVLGRIDDNTKVIPGHPWPAGKQG